MHEVIGVDGFIHLRPEGERKPPIPHNRCAGPSEQSKQEFHTTKNERGKWGGGGGGVSEGNSNYLGSTVLGSIGLCCYFSVPL